MSTRTNPFKEQEKKKVTYTEVKTIWSREGMEIRLWNETSFTNDIGASATAHSNYASANSKH